MTAEMRLAGVASGFHVAPPIAMTSLWRSAGIAIDCAAKSFTSSSCVKSSISQMRGREITQGWLVMRARSEEHTSELQSLMRISYAVFCLKKKTHTNKIKHEDQVD